MPRSRRRSAIIVSRWRRWQSGSTPWPATSTGWRSSAARPASGWAAAPTGGGGAGRGPGEGLEGAAQRRAQLAERRAELAAEVTRADGRAREAVLDRDRLEGEVRAAAEIPQAPVAET